MSIMAGYSEHSFYTTAKITSQFLITGRNATIRYSPMSRPNNHEIKIESG